MRWLNTPSAWQDIQYRRERRGAAIKQRLDLMNGAGTAIAGALQNNISGFASNAVQAAVARIQADAKAKSVEMTKQIDDAQRVLDATKASTGSGGVNTVA